MTPEAPARPEGGSGERIPDRDPLRFALPNEAERLAAACEEVRGYLAGRGVGRETQYAVDLVLEELAGNVVRHGYADGARGELRIAVSVDPQTVRVAIDDDARPFDPTRHPEPPRAGALQDAPPGGRGIPMVRHVASAMRYRREDGRNRLEVEVPRGSAG